MSVKEQKLSGLELLRKPFPAHQISKLPKPTKAQTEAVKADYKKGIRCQLCQTWHHPDVVHLDYVGHAALTDRLLEADPNWSWEPLAFEDGLPKFDKSGGLWIKLTVCGVARLGYGHAENSTFKEAGSREKEVIGDALRNAAMRFGAALELWHKGQLHIEDSVESHELISSNKDAIPSVFKEDKDLGEFLFEFGKFKGHRFKDFEKWEIVEYVKWLKSRDLSNVSGKLKEAMLNTIKAGEIYVGEIAHGDPKFDKNESFQF